MNKLSFLIKKSVLDKQSYHLPEVDYRLKLNQNENPYDLPEEIKSEIVASIQENNWNRYSELGSEKVRDTIATSIGLSWQHVMVGNGSNEILLAIMLTLLEAGKKMITISPTFSLYKHYGEILNAHVDTIPLEKDFQFPISTLCDIVNQTDVVLTILCSPNNPTGNCIDRNDLIKILNKAQGFVMVDEAYYDFCDQDFSDLIPDFPNLILTRTFSKACAFSFGRFGYGIAAPEFVHEIYKVFLPYNLSGFAEQAASIFIRKKNDLNPMILHIISQREFLVGELKKIKGITPYPSQANFVLTKPNKNSGWLFQKLVEQKILVRDVSHYPGLGNHLRITVGKPEENVEVVKALQDILG